MTRFRIGKVSLRNCWRAHSNMHRLVTFLFAKISIKYNRCNYYFKFVLNEEHILFSQISELTFPTIYDTNKIVSKFLKGVF